MMIALAGALALTLDGQAAPAPPPPAEAPAAQQSGGGDQEQGGVRFVWRDHPSLRAGSLLRVDFVGKFHWDARRPGDDPPDFETAEIHRARVGIEGEVFRRIQFSIEREFTERELTEREIVERELAGARTTDWKDVYVELNYVDVARVRLGKFKVPFGLDQLTSVANLDFVYRSLGGSYLAPGRDVGVMLFGRAFDRRLNYWGGVFRQDGDNARSRRTTGGDETVAVRATVLPFRTRKASRLEDLEIGSAVTVSRLSDASPLPNGLRARTMMSQYVFFEPVFVRGRRQRVEIDADWATGPVGLRGEYTEVRDSREGQGLMDDRLPDARARSWYVSGAVVVTGERKQRPVNPRPDFGRGGIGAVELVGRYERLRFDSVGGGPGPALRNPRAEMILPSGDRILTFGVNWYLNRWVKLQAQGVRERLEDPERSSTLDGSAFWNGLFRLQFTI